MYSSHSYFTSVEVTPLGFFVHKCTPLLEETHTQFPNMLHNIVFQPDEQANSRVY